MKKLALTDFAKYRYPSALELSPDGRYLTFALKEVDREGDGYRWNLWLYDLESRESRQITSSARFFLAVRSSGSFLRAGIPSPPFGKKMFSLS